MSARQSKRVGRRAGSSGESRAAILAAARALFAKHGFRGTTVRAIADRAGVDLALVHYFFGTKDKLFAAVVELPIAPERIAALLTGDGPRGERLARFYLDHLFTGRNKAITALLRAALGDPGCIPAVRTLIQETLVAGAAGAIGGPDARLRAELIGAHMVGLFICRCMIGVEPLASASIDELVARIAPALDALLGPESQFFGTR